MLVIRGGGVLRGVESIASKDEMLYNLFGSSLVKLARKEASIVGR